jgi:hypothetical protein
VGPARQVEERDGAVATVGNAFPLADGAVGEDDNVRSDAWGCRRVGEGFGVRAEGWWDAGGTSV